VVDPRDRDQHREREELLEPLAEAYRSLIPSEASEQLGGCDERTQAAVGWMQEAWAELELPAQPERHAQRPWARSSRRLGLGVLLTLAALWCLLLLGEELRPVAPNREPGSSMDNVALLEGPEPGPAPQDESATEHEDPAPDPDLGPEAEPRAETVQVFPGKSANNIEFRTGKVTLVLVTSAAPEPTPRQDSK